MGVPDIHACRVSVFARGRHLGDFFPGWVSKIELPDGGAVHLSTRPSTRTSGLRVSSATRSPSSGAR
jgi:hypothetical protein